MGVPQRGPRGSAEETSHRDLPVAGQAVTVSEGGKTMAREKYGSKKSRKGGNSEGRLNA